MMDNSNFNRVQAVINLDNIRDNITAMKRLIDGDKKMLAVIKADAYGHGAVEVAEALDDLVDFFAVAFIDEALELRRANIDKPILILGYTDPSDYELILRYDVRPAMYEVDDAQKLSDLAVSMNTKAKIHIKVDTGMGRIGFTCDEDGVKNIEKISQMPGIEIEGIFTHYAKADELDKTDANGQLEKFRWINSQLEALGIHIPVRHISNSAGIMEMDNSDFDMVRSGIVTYGLYPSDEVDKNIAALKPAMRLMSKVIFVKDVKAGTGIGYGWSYIADHDIKVATVSAGYADGYPRAQSNIGRVIIHGEYAPIIGRVCMDQFMVDVSHIDGVKVRDDVTLIGQDGDREVTVEEVAAPANSFNYELVCNISRRVPRTYIRDGRELGQVNYLLD